MRLEVTHGAYLGAGNTKDLLPGFPGGQPLGPGAIRTNEEFCLHQKGLEDWKRASWNYDGLLPRRAQGLQYARRRHLPLPERRLVRGRVQGGQEARPRHLPPLARPLARGRVQGGQDARPRHLPLPERRLVRGRVRGGQEARPRHLPLARRPQQAAGVRGRRALPMSGAGPRPVMSDINNDQK